MKTLQLCIFGIICLFLSEKAVAQQYFNTKTKQFKPSSDTLYLDSLSLVPGSIKLLTSTGDSIRFRINYKLHAIILEGLRPDSLHVIYKIFPYNFEAEYYHKNPGIILSDLSRPDNPFAITFNNDNASQNIFMNDGLNKNGSISRGITFGNNQDVVVNSNLNLQVSGKLTPEIDMVMAATDNNIPFQPDGTTAQLQEFDKVFIQLSDFNTKLIVGDYQLSRPENSYFMNFYKRAQGAYVSNIYTDSSGKKPLTFKTQVAGAVSKGKFARNVIFGNENNQGPYRLVGANNEPFVIVLSGTEKIYIDGKLLQRGQENDYIIDYNTAEVIFTARQIITKDKRIVAEFQYAERNYGRSLFYAGEEIKTGKLKVFINLYSEQDNKNKPLQQALTQQQKQILFAIGDTLNKAYYSGAEISSFNNSDVFYQKKDTLTGSIVYKDIFVYSTNPDSAKYRVRFSNVGNGNGNYIQIASTANGKVYKWIAPVSGVPQGNYEPVIPLITPKQNQMLTGGLEYKFNKNHNIWMEGVYTKNDINKFSPYDSYDNEGSGYKLKSFNQVFLQKDTSIKHPLRFIYNFNYEYVQKNFTQVERFRTIEFQRDWNRPYFDRINTDQHIANAELGIEKANAYKLIYGVNWFNEGSFFSGYKQQLNTRFSKKRFLSEYNASYLNTNNNNLYKTTFYRHKSLLSQGVGKLKFTLSDEFENNSFKSDSSNSFLPAGYLFWDWEASVANADTSKNRIKIFYRERRDRQAYNNELKDSTFAQNAGMQLGFYGVRNHPVTVLVTYRELHLRNAIISALKPDNSLLSRLEYNPRFMKGFITASLFYETGYGLENRKEFYYIEVAPGQGQYAWKDYNENNIKELNEFEVAQFADQAKFIRVYTPTNQYIKVLQNQLSFSFNLKPSVLLKETTGALGKNLARFSLQSVYRVDNKTYDKGDFFNYSFFESVVADTNLLAANFNLRQSIFFNQTAAVFGADYTFTNTKNKQLLLNGYDLRDNYSHEVRWRLNFLKAWSINSINSSGVKTYESGFFTLRNYKINFYDVEQKLNYQPSTAFRVSGIYKLTYKQNNGQDVIQKAVITDYGFELKYNESEKGSLNARTDFLVITYNADENSPIAYEMLNALRVGYNYTWNINYQRNLSNNIQISINYDGRKSPGARTVHIGGAQIRAFF